MGGYALALLPPPKAAPAKAGAKGAGAVLGGLGATPFGVPGGFRRLILELLELVWARLWVTRWRLQGVLPRL